MLLIFHDNCIVTEWRRLISIAYREAPEGIARIGQRILLKAEHAAVPRWTQTGGGWDRASLAPRADSEMPTPIDYVDSRGQSGNVAGGTKPPLLTRSGPRHSEHFRIGLRTRPTSWCRLNLWQTTRGGAGESQCTKSLCDSGEVQLGLSIIPRGEMVGSGGSALS